MSLGDNESHMNKRKILRRACAFIVLLILVSIFPRHGKSQTTPFHLAEATIQDVHNAYKSGRVTAHQLVQLYLKRIEAFDKKGPNLNAIITVNSRALQEADQLDAAFKSSGNIGPLHGIPVIIKDQMDAKGMPTTLGSILFKNYFPDPASSVAETLRMAGAIILSKTPLGELARAGTPGSLFGSPRIPFASSRTSLA